jgi:predicted DNA-binding protein YlxM (UPF0122 family)
MMPGIDLPMVNYKEILRLNSFGLKKTQIADSCNCSRTTVIDVLKRTEECDLNWEKANSLSNEELANKIMPANKSGVTYHIPDYEYIHREMAKSGVTLGLLWLEYCEECSESGLVPYKHT